jgi:hypothetical protein
MMPAIIAAKVSATLLFVKTAITKTGTASRRTIKTTVPVIAKIFLSIEKILVRILLACHMMALRISAQRQFMAGTCPTPQ